MIYKATWRICGLFYVGLTQRKLHDRAREHVTAARERSRSSALGEHYRTQHLGVTFDKHLFYGPHLQRIALRAAQRIGFLRKSFKVLDTHGRFAAYKGFVRPMLEYCPLVWAGAAPHHLSRLDKIQKRALSLIGPGVSVDSLALSPQREQSLPTPQTDEWSAPPYARQPAPPTESASYGAKNATPTRRDAPFPTLGYPPEKVQRHHFEIISVRTDCSMEFPPSLRRESGTCIKGPARLQNTGV